jgi:hypothetical protein
MTTFYHENTYVQRYHPDGRAHPPRPRPFSHDHPIHGLRAGQQGHIQQPAHPGRGHLVVDRQVHGELDEGVFGRQRSSRLAGDGDKLSAGAYVLVIHRGRSRQPHAGEGAPVQLDQDAVGAIPLHRDLAEMALLEGWRPGLLAAVRIAERLQRGLAGRHLLGSEPQVQVAHLATGRIGIGGVGQHRALEQDRRDARLGQGNQPAAQLHLAPHGFVERDQASQPQGRPRLGRDLGCQARLGESKEDVGRQPAAAQPLDGLGVQVIGGQPAGQRLRAGRRQGMEKRNGPPRDIPRRPRR